MLASRQARWSLACAMVCAVLLAVTWFTLIAPRRQHVAEVRAAQVSTQQANDVLRAKVGQLKAEYADMPRTRAQLDQLRSQLPATADVSALVRTLSSLSTSSGTQLISITPGAPTAISATESAGATAAATKPSAATLVAVPMAVVVKGDYFSAVTFVRQLQTGMPRAFLISSLLIAPQDEASPDTVRLTITGNVFSRPTTANTAVAAAQVTAGAASAPAAATTSVATAAQGIAGTSAAGTPRAASTAVTDQQTSGRSTW